VANQLPQVYSGRSRSRPPHAVLLTKREVVALVLALEEVPPILLGQLIGAAASAHKKLSALTFVDD